MRATYLAAATDCTARLLRLLPTLSRPLVLLRSTEHTMPLLIQGKQIFMQIWAFGKHESEFCAPHKRDVITRFLQCEVGASLAGIELTRN
jgi:hypothetical protein